MVAGRVGSVMVCGIVLASLVRASGQEEKKPDKTVDIRGDPASYVESGKKEPAEVIVVVGQTVRWQNRDERDHRVTSDLKVEGKPLFDTGVIKPGEFKDVFLDINVYAKAGGKRAGAVTLTYHCAANPDLKGTIVLLSAAKR